MNKSSIVILLAAVVCSTYGVSTDRRSVRSSISEVVDVSSPATPVADAVADSKEPKDSAVAESTNIFTARGGNKKGGGHKNNKMEMMHMGLSYVKMVLSTFMSIIGHIFAFKSVGLTLISVLIQIAQFIMVLKKNKESHPPTYKIVETPWHTQSPPESYGGSYNSYSKAGTVNGINNSPYGIPTAQRRR